MFALKLTPANSFSSQARGCPFPRRPDRQKVSVSTQPEDLAINSSPVREGFPLVFDRYSPQFFADPYPVYRRLRDETPAYRLTYVWAVLSAITVGTWWLGHTSARPDMSSRTVVMIAALAIAAVKVQLIVRYFMEVRTAPSWLRVSTTIWLVLLVGLIAAIYLW